MVRFWCGDGQRDQNYGNSECTPSLAQHSLATNTLVGEDIKRSILLVRHTGNTKMSGT